MQSASLIHPLDLSILSIFQQSDDDIRLRRRGNNLGLLRRRSRTCKIHYGQAQRISLVKPLFYPELESSRRNSRLQLVHCCSCFAQDGYILAGCHPCKEIS